MKPSRRRFLQSSLGLPLTARLGGPGRPITRLFGASGAVQEQELFPDPHIIRYDSACFTIRRQDTLVLSGAFHYPRCPKALWRDRLLKFKLAGFNTIETYVFWNYHEPQEGRADLSEFEEFIGLVKEMGFWMIARPGPYICAEWDAGGFPHWVIQKRFPLRSNHPESIRASQHWFDLVLPIIQRHQVVLGGPIIMMQLENEYDYWNLPEGEKQEYIRALAQMAWNAGIMIPLITCWTRQVRNRSDPAMARIMDTCNFYPRWNVVQEVVPALEKLRKEEPASPVSVTELQGGWFSELGGKLSIDQDGVDGAQLNLLAKTVLEQGVTYFNCYMGFGGTNFDWAAKGLTTTYDYAAPIREPGGLWEKYYVARGIGVFLAQFGSVLARAGRAEGATQSTPKDVSITERVSGKSAVLFVRENSNAEQRFKMTFQDPNSPTRRTISVPREGELALGPREMKMLPVQVAIPGSQLRYSTAEVLASGLNLDRHFLIVYDEPGRLVEIGLATQDEPHVEGDPLYQYWDPEYESVVIGLRVEKAEKIILVNGHLLVVVVPRERALRSWTAEFPSQVVMGAEETKPLAVPFLTDSVLVAASGSTKKGIWADLDFLPGEHDLTLLLPPVPARFRVDGVPKDFQYDRQWRTARGHITTPPIPCQPIPLRDVQYWVEKAGQPGAEALNTPLRPLEELGSLPYGYVKYVADQFRYGGEPKLFISAFADDEKKVFLNGKLVAEASNSKKQVEFALPNDTPHGINTLEIYYELFGSPNFGENIGELKGLESVRMGSDSRNATAITPWQIQRFSAPAGGRGIDPGQSIGGWTPATLPGSSPKQELVSAFTWCRAEFALAKPAEGWSVPWKVTLEADRDALLYLNGKFVGRCVTIGPQKDFYLPDPYLVFDPKRKNLLTLVLAYADHPGHIRTLRVSPYDEFSTRRTRVEYEW